MNPVIVIPSYWTEKDRPAEIGRVGDYDHATPIDKPLPELQTCLESLEPVRGVLRVIVLLVAPPDCEPAARARVDGICRMHPQLNPLVIGSPEAAEVKRVVDRIAPRLEGDPISLRGYGAIRNMGLAVAAALGHDVVVFLDDDEVALDENFLLDAIYGLGMETRQGLMIYAKSGYYLRKGSPYADQRTPSLRNRYWTKRVQFNQWMKAALAKTRISRSNMVCGGCFALSAQAFTKVSFDPQITRGEDLDYLLNLRMYGHDVWFDNRWRVNHLPPKIPSRAARFLQDVYRWEYELAKLDYANSTKSLRQVRPESLAPYPESFLTPEVRANMSRTALLRALVGPERKDYLKIWLVGHRRAQQWAHQVRGSYFAFQTHWPRIMSQIWGDRALRKRLERMGTPRQMPPRHLPEDGGESAHG